jgi:hypothetical protein
VSSNATKPSTIPTVRQPASSILVPENAPSLLWRHMTQHRADAAQRNLVAGVTSVPFAWDECSDWMATLAEHLNRVIGSGETAPVGTPVATETPAPPSVAADAVPAAAPPAATPAAATPAAPASAAPVAGAGAASAVPPRVQMLKQLVCTQLMQAVMNTEFALAYALMRQRCGHGALFVGMRDFLHLTQDTPEAAATRQIWFAWLTLPELQALKTQDARVTDAAVAVQEMAQAAASVKQRDFYFFADDADFSLCIGAPRFLAEAQRSELCAGAAPELQNSDMFVVDLPTRRRFTCRFTNIQVQIEAWKADGAAAAAAKETAQETAT